MTAAIFDQDPVAPPGLPPLWVMLGLILMGGAGALIFIRSRSSYRPNLGGMILGAGLLIAAVVILLVGHPW